MIFFIIIFIRSIVFNLLFYVSTALTSIWCSTVLRYSSRETLVRFLGRWARLNVWLLKVVVGIDLKVEGLHHFSTIDKPLIIASKHQSTWDTFIFHVLCDDPAYVMKQGLFRIPFYGTCAKKVGMIGINRTEKAASLKNLVKGVSAALDRKQTVIIFPEGTRVSPRRESSYQHGVYLLYHRMKDVSVVPVALNSGKHWSRNSWMRYPGTIHVVFLPPMPTKLNRESFMKTLSVSIENACAKLP